LASLNVLPGERTVKSTLPAMVCGLSRLPEPKTTIAARGALRLSVDTEACDEKLLVESRVRSESLLRTRICCVSFANRSAKASVR
jgi:hypothetical protein